MSRPHGTTEASLIAAAGRVGGPWRTLAKMRLKTLCGSPSPRVEAIVEGLRVSSRQARRIRRELGFGPMLVRRNRVGKRRAA